ATILLMLMASIGIGVSYAYEYPFPVGLLRLDDINNETFVQVRRIEALGNFGARFIFLNNLRVIILAGIMSLFSFGSLVLFLAIANGAFVSFLVTQIIILDYNPWLFMLTFMAPHGILEIPAVLLGFTFALRIGAGLVAPPQGLDVGQGLLFNLANYLKLLVFLIIPMLMVAAIIEAHITPYIVVWVYSSG
ncbi:stage II sporulation protein M, partial [Anaerolineales bacterium HSG24]|nr:stage II sporulation protein M [Anaerolineales bacterium HSG24]